MLTLGPEEGFDNNVVEATFPNNPGAAAVFTASGKVAGDPADTTISGVVLDNSNNPVEGVTLHIERTGLTTLSDAQGQFVLQSVPVGRVLLSADGSTVPPRNGMPWPKLEYEMVTIAGHDNTVGMPIYLLPIDTPRGIVVDETHGGTLTLDELPGFSLTVVPGSATFPDGGRRGTVSVTLVHADKVPMVPNFGQQPRFIITIQPPGTHFNPPAAMTMPNVDGLAPGQKTEMYSFDHDLGAFVSIGPATVSEDGTVVQSDPGVGVVKGGWHCGGNPSPTGSAGDCPDCWKCEGSQCVPDPNNPPPGKQCCRPGNPSPYDPQTQCCETGEIVNKFPIQDLSQCPNRVTRQGYSHVPPNGCGKYYKDNNIRVIADTIIDFPAENPTATYAGCSLELGQAPAFTEYCNQHDQCYENCEQRFRGECDSNYREGLIALCNSRVSDPACLFSCQTWARLYARAVETFGEGTYESSQKDACQCCPDIP